MRPSSRSTHRCVGLSALLLAALPAPTRAAEAPPPTWVFFAERDLPGDTLVAAVDARAAELSARALARRARARGDLGVDARDLPPPQARVAAVLATGARLRSTSRWLNAVSVDADAAQLAAIADLPGVAELRPVARRSAAPSPELRPRDLPPRAPAPRSAGPDPGVALDQLALLDIPFLHACGLTGAGVVVGVQDSGFSLEHAALAGVDVLAARDFVRGDDTVADQPDDPNGQHNHGTMVLSLLAGDAPGEFLGAAPGVSVILAKTEDIAVEQPFEEDRFVEGLEWIESMGADVFTSSLGYLDWYTPEDLDGATAVTSRAAAVAAEQGLLMFVAVGNSGPGPTTLAAPSDADGVLAVGAIDLTGALSEFSSRGPTADGRIKPDLLAPGQDVWLANPNSADRYGQSDGTSFAAPLAAGAAALLLEALPDLDAASARALLRQSASQADAPDNDRGWGVPDLRLPLLDFCACQDADGDGARAAACGGDDCDDADPTIHPDADERCNDRDDDCDQRVDDDCTADPEPAPTTSGDPGTSSTTTDAPADIPPDADPRPDPDAAGCDVALQSWTSALLLPWLLLGARRPRRAR